MASVFALEVAEDLLDHHRIFDAGDDLDVATAAVVGLDVDIEHASSAAPKSWRHGVRRVWGRPSHPPCWPCYPCRAWPALPANDARCWGASAVVGHHDRRSLRPGLSPLANVHPSKGCSQQNLVDTGGAGLFLLLRDGLGKKKAIIAQKCRVNRGQSNLAIPPRQISKDLTP